MYTVKLTTFLFNLNHISNLDNIRWNIYKPIVDHDMAMQDKLTAGVLLPWL